MSNSNNDHQLTGKASILIVDDNPSDRNLVQRYLTDSRADITVVFANSGEEAFGFMEQHDFDCAVVDFRLPGMTGNAFAEKLTSGDSGTVIPVVMLTGYENEVSAQAAKNAGVAEYLSKEKLTAEAIQRAVFTTINSTKRGTGEDDAGRSNS
ncbi:MAG: response regulator [Gammaproteobacteria bacterium]|nr:response regulator [Gammaproteobacteria bacterium]